MTRSNAAVRRGQRGSPRRRRSAAEAGDPGEADHGDDARPRASRRARLDCRRGSTRTPLIRVERRRAPRPRPALHEAAGGDGGAETARADEGRRAWKAAEANDEAERPACPSNSTRSSCRRRRPNRSAREIGPSKPAMVSRSGPNGRHGSQSGTAAAGAARVVNASTSGARDPRLAATGLRQHAAASAVSTPNDNSRPSPSPRRRFPSTARACTVLSVAPCRRDDGTSYRQAGASLAPWHGRPVRRCVGTRGGEPCGVSPGIEVCTRESGTGKLALAHGTPRVPLVIGRLRSSCPTASTRTLFDEVRLRAPTPQRGESADHLLPQFGAPPSSPRLCGSKHRPSVSSVPPWFVLAPAGFAR